MKIRSEMLIEAGFKEVYWKTVSQGEYYSPEEIRRAYDINDCTVESLDVKGGKIRLVVESEVDWDTPLLILFRDVPQGKNEITVNGESLGEYDAGVLEKGIKWFFKKRLSL